jgi:hypothetical protein
VKGKTAAELLEATPAENMKELIPALLHRIEVGQDRLSIVFRSVELRRLLVWDDKHVFRGRPADWSCSDARYELDVEVTAISAERWPLVHIAAYDPAAHSYPNTKLIRLIGRARKALQLVEDHREWSIDELARAFYCRPAHFTRLIRLNYLAPDIVTSILDGTQPPALKDDLLLKTNLPTDWAIQRRLLGFPAPRRELDPLILYGRGLWPSAAQAAAQRDPSAPPS